MDRELKEEEVGYEVGEEGSADPGALVSRG